MDTSEALFSGGGGPVERAARIVSIDVLRGFAVLGILVMNIQSFSMISAAYLNPHAFGDVGGGNYLGWILSHIFADSKRWTGISDQLTVISDQNKVAV